MARPIGQVRFSHFMCVAACLLSSVSYGQYPGYAPAGRAVMQPNPYCQPCPPYSGAPYPGMPSQGYPQPYPQQMQPQPMPPQNMQQRPMQPNQQQTDPSQPNQTQPNQQQQQDPNTPPTQPQQNPNLQAPPTASPFANMQNDQSLAAAMQSGSGSGGSGNLGNYAPNMVGDSLGTFGSAFFDVVHNDPLLGTQEAIFGEFDIPVTGRIPKIAENNSPMPRDRVYFAYNHFHGAYSYDPDQIAENPFFDPLDPLSQPFFERSPRLLEDVNRFTLGIEKTFFSDDISIELRLPLMTQAGFSTDSLISDGITAFETATDDPTGDLAINYKQILYTAYGQDSSFLFSWGMGLTLPTGEGNTTRIFDTYLHIDDSAIHFNPFLALLLTKQRFFMQAFFQLDLTNDDIRVREGTNGEVAEFRAPHRSHIDLGLGYWIFRDTSRYFFQGLAPVLEFHYTGQINKTEPVSIPLTGTFAAGQIDLNTPASSRDVYNLTTGFNVQLTNWANCRVAGVLPITTDPNREFDSEIVFQLDLTR